MNTIYEYTMNTIYESLGTFDTFITAIQNLTNEGSNLYQMTNQSQRAAISASHVNLSTVILWVLL